MFNDFSATFISPFSTPASIRPFCSSVTFSLFSKHVGHAWRLSHSPPHAQPMYRIISGVCAQPSFAINDNKNQSSSIRSSKLPNKPPRSLALFRSSRHTLTSRPNPAKPLSRPVLLNKPVPPLLPPEAARKPKAPPNSIRRRQKQQDPHQKKETRPPPVSACPA